MQKKRFFAALWALTKPYWVSEKRSTGLILLATVVGLALLGVWLEVQFNTWNREFYNTFETKDQDEFFRQLGTFTILAVLYIINGVYRVYFQQMLTIEWRTWLTERYLADWLKDRAYYRLQLSDKGTDNPDQRIAEDLNGFVDLTLTLVLGLLSAVVTLVVLHRHSVGHFRRRSRCSASRFRATWSGSRSSTRCRQPGWRTSSAGR